jgi:uncharacterized protein YcbK (DUF882 family)
MGNVSEHFNREEFACSCGCGFAAVDAELLEIAELIRSRIGAFSPTCACRCLEHNRSLGSKDTSQHVKAMAMDIPIEEDEIREVTYKWLDEEILTDRGGLGNYPKRKFIHVDVRKNKARWSKE